MSSYHFFVASLPMLLPDAAPPMTLDGFLELARVYLSAADWQTLTALEAGRPSQHSFVKGWRRAETQLRNAIARQRASRLGQDAAPWLKEHEGYDVTLERSVAAAFQESNPLRREKALDAIRWRQADELAGLDSFATPAILAYFIQLQILARAAERDVAQGRARRQSIVDPTPGQKDTPAPATAVAES